MKRQVSPAGEVESEWPSSASCWWRTAREHKEKANIEIDLTSLPNLKPRQRVLGELERLASAMPQGLAERRTALIQYRSGSFWRPTGGIKKDDMDIPPIITILLVGFSGSGKSSLVNLMYSVLGNSGLTLFSQTSSDGALDYTTMFMEEHNVLRSMQNGFCVFDTRGLNQTRLEESLEEVSGWMADGVRHNQLCWRHGDERLKKDKITAPSICSVLSSSRFITRAVNCALVVASLKEIHDAFERNEMAPIDAIRDLFFCRSIRKSNENPILILTHGDKLKVDDRIEARVRICERLGISEMSGVYDIACLTEQGIMAEQSDPVTAYALIEAVYRALLQADRTHLPKMKPRDWVVLCGSWLMCAFAAFFALLASFFSKLGHRNKLKLCANLKI